jgi:hypothetical protein
MEIKCDQPEEVVKEAFWIAWQACGRPQGLGMLQNRPNATKEDVWNNIRQAGDYEGGAITNPDKPGDAYGDYVFGRMMKLGIKWNKEAVIVREDSPRIDYQSWCLKYPSYKTLIDAAIDSLSANA